LASVSIQDHGGHWWRHGSLNIDRHWELEYTPTIAYGLRANRLREGKEAKPWRCPECSRICTRRACICGYEPKTVKVPKPVVSTDGELKMHSGDVFAPRRICKRPGAEKIWERMYWRSRTEKGARTFAAAFAMFARENYYQYPDPSWPFMPLNELDVFRLVADVPMNRLVPKEQPNGPTANEEAQASLSQ
jgi:hypothetical protein